MAAKKSEAPAKTQTLGDAKASDGQKNVAKCMEYIKANTSVTGVTSRFLSDKQIFAEHTFDPDILISLVFN